MNLSRLLSPKLSVILAVITMGGGLGSTAHAQFIIAYDFTGGSAGASVTGTDAAKVSAENFSDVGDAGISSNSEMAFLSMGGTGVDLASALADSNYFTVTLSAANPGEVLDLTSMTLDFGGSTNAGAPTPNLVVQSSVGGFGSGNPILTVTPSSFALEDASVNSNPQLTAATVNISSTAFDNLSTVTFQFRFFDDNNTGNNFDRLDNVEFQGTVIPEPASVALLFGGLTALAVFWRRRKA